MSLSSEPPRPSSGAVSALLAFAVCTWGAPRPAVAESSIVKDGQPQAEIVIAEKPARVVELAASELQHYIAKISGAKLAIVAKPSDDCPVQIYVGKSAHADRLKITDDDLKHGAFRMVSGGNWLALVGLDKSFVCSDLLRMGRSPNRKERAKMMEEWHKRTGENWGLPYSQFWKQHNVDLGISELDEHGSLNAVCHFLGMLGVRWYMPNALGEIVPKKPTIPLPQVNKTVRPDFAYRFAYQYGRRFRGASRDEIMWQLRMGFNQAPDVVGVGYIAHGTALVIGHPEVKAAHPEFYALVNGKRLTDGKHAKHGKPCLSSPGLIEQNVKFVRAMFDILDAPMVSVMPTDGFTSLCQCDRCKDAGTPERGWNGQFSDYVWGYVDRVAREVYKTHPDKKIVGMAYTTYLLPPAKIDKFSPNVVVGIAQARSRFRHDPTTRKMHEELRKGYLAKLPKGDKKLCVYEYYRYAVPGKPYEFMPAFFPHGVADDLRSLRDISFGDFVEVHRDRASSTIGVTHLNLYVTGRLWWDADHDVDALLDEYYVLFYGPARAEMKAFIEYSEANWMDLRQDTAKIDKVLELLAKAQQKTPADSVYAERIALIANYVKPMQDLRKQLAKGRGDVPLARIMDRDANDIRMDGKLNDKFWERLPGSSGGRLRELQTGRKPAFGTTFKAAWAGDNIYFGIKCMDRDTKSLNIAATRNEDTTIWNGDCVEILLETQTHSYYQLAISPTGALVDLDRKGGLKMLWSSNAEVAAHVGEGYWSLEVRIPVAGELQGNIDPLNGVAGRKPSKTYPWYINLCRQRVRENGTEHSAFSPTGESGFHHPMKFAKLHMKF